MVTEPVLNTVLAEYLRKGLARVIGMPETRIRLRKIRALDSRTFRSWMCSA
jgi:hypothetical protein